MDGLRLQRAVLNHTLGSSPRRVERVYSLGSTTSAHSDRVFAVLEGEDDIVIKAATSKHLNMHGVLQASPWR